MVNETHIRRIDDACAQALSVIGFKTRKRGILTFDIVDGFQGWIGLNTATRESPAAMYVNPMIGVRADAIQSIIARVNREKPHSYVPATITRNLGYFMPDQQFASYEFPYSEDASDRAAKMAQDVQKFGLPFMIENASISRIIGLVPSYAIWEDASERLLVAHYVDGKDRRFLLDFIENRVGSGKIEKRLWQRFDAFATSFQQQFLDNDKPE
jgi:hypothetical protein